MELKEYQIKTLEKVKQYLDLLSDWRQKSLQNPDLEINFPAKAWEKTGNLYNYLSRKDGLNRPLPNFCLKIPTGGGKTLLAVETVGLINTNYRKKQTGLVLWVVPTTQIYRQTIKSLRNRDHPYRQHLDIASAGRTLIREKTDHFSPQDVRENLVILMLMLPSASRQNKETLKVFKDAGGFQDFFPPEDSLQQNIELLKNITNLDTFEKKSAFWKYQIKTSLGNTLRLLSPVIILDEGHKAYSQTAQHTLHNFNPSIIVELSATPSQSSNALVDISGMDLNREEMIKLDLHIFNKASTDYHDTLLSAVNKRNCLEEKAADYHANTNINIRPICLIQVERTGKDQRTGKFIHAEDVREHLIKIVGIPPDQIAVKTSEKDELKEVDDVGGLMTPDCPIRYVITKAALQEGWDCAFAYVLAVLTNPSSKTALTQLVGRILRQPYARKTKIKDLDESYVFCFQQNGVNLMKEIRLGFGREGLGDLTSNVFLDEDSDAGLFGDQEKWIEVRDEFKTAAKNIILPLFVIKDSNKWRQVHYEMDIASQIPWDQADLKPLYNLQLSYFEQKDIEHITSLSDDIHQITQQKEIVMLKEGGLRIDHVFMARQLTGIVANPWIAYEFGKKIIKTLLRNNDENLVKNNFVTIIEESRKHLAHEKDRLSEMIFMNMLAQDSLRFWVISRQLGFKLPLKKKIKKTAKTLTKSNNQPLRKSLFDFVPENEFNELEKKVAWYLEDQRKLYFWYRNNPRREYPIQGWRKNKIYPDFITASDARDDPVDFDRIFIIETKGEHLLGSDESDYKKKVFSLCTKLAQKKHLTDLGLEIPDKTIQYRFIEQDLWHQKITALFA